MRRRAFSLYLLVLLLLGAAQPARRAFGQDNSSAHIVSPQSGTLLFGVVTIIGTASNPSMQLYRLEYLAQADPNPQWQPVAKPVSQQVTNGILGQWDTTALPDGVYQLRLRVTLRNGTIFEDYAKELKVSNKQPTPLPTSQPAATALLPTVPPTAGPSPTLLIQQPPTGTPRAAGIALPTSAPAVSDGAPPSSLSLAIGAVQSAICSGALIAFAGFVLLGIYVFIRDRMRRAPSNLDRGG